MTRAASSHADSRVWSLSLFTPFPHMDQYVVSARKYRPSTFASVVGQKALTETLKNAINTGRLASSYLFCGSRGVGKTTCARIFAKAINCEHRTPDGEPCNRCDSCRSFNDGVSLNIMELDAASNNSVDDLRRLTSQVQVPPTSGRYRVFIIDEVHMLTSGAFNAFLKTLEEPPSYVVFILATTEKQKIIPTILSRCQIYDFRRITTSDMIDHMAWVASQEGIEAETSALNVIASKADGAMRDALSIFDQLAASTRGHITYQAALDNLNMLDSRFYSKLLDAFLGNRVLDTWLIYKEIRERGFDSLFFINGLADYFRNLMAATTEPTLQLIEANDDARKALAEDARRCTPEFLLRSMALLNDADLQYRTSSAKQFLVELTLAKICQQSSPSPSDGGSGEGHLKPVAAATAPVSSTTSTAVTHSGAAVPTTTAGNPTPASSTPQSATPAQRAHTASPAVRPIVRRATTLHAPSISINAAPGANNAKQQPAQAPTATAGTATAPAQQYTHNDLIAAWNEYGAAHPKAHILVNTMRACIPQPSSRPDTFVTKVLNEFQRTEMQQAMPDLLAFLRREVGNNNITIQVEIDSSAPPRHTLSDRDLLAELRQANPLLQKYIDFFHLNLS